MTDLIAVPEPNPWHKLKALVLDSVSSPITKRVYNLGLDEFFAGLGIDDGAGRVVGGIELADLDRFDLVELGDDRFGRAVLDVEGTEEGRRGDRLDDASMRARQGSMVSDGGVRVRAGSLSRQLPSCSRRQARRPRGSRARPTTTAGRSRPPTPGTVCPSHAACLEPRPSMRKAAYRFRLVTIQF